MNKASKNQKPDFEEVCDIVASPTRNSCSGDEKTRKISLPAIGTLFLQNHDDGNITCDANISFPGKCAYKFAEFIVEVEKVIKGKKNELA